MLSLCLFACLLVCLLTGLHKDYSTDFLNTEFVGKAAQGPWKNPLDYGGNPDHVTLGLGLW